MKEIWLTKVLFRVKVKEIIVGPANDRPGAVKLGNNQSITQEKKRMLLKQLKRLAIKLNSTSS